MKLESRRPLQQRHVKTFMLASQNGSFCRQLSQRFDDADIGWVQALGRRTQLERQHPRPSVSGLRKRAPLERVFSVWP